MGASLAVLATGAVAVDSEMVIVTMSDKDVASYIDGSGIATHTIRVDPPFMFPVAFGQHCQIEQFRHWIEECSYL